MAGQTTTPDMGRKDDSDKPRIELISAIATVKKAQVMGHGAKKYGVDNWRKGIAWLRVIGALLRHTFAYLSGETNDPETGLSHMAHAACCCDFLLEYEDTHKELDDRHGIEKDDPKPVFGSMEVPTTVDPHDGNVMFCGLCDSYHEEPSHDIHA